MLHVYGRKNLLSVGGKFLTLGAIAINVIYIVLLLYSVMGTAATAQQFAIQDAVTFEQVERIEIIE
jgi:hypothetical protein